LIWLKTTLLYLLVLLDAWFQPVAAWYVLEIHTLIQ